MPQRLVLAGAAALLFAIAGCSTPDVITDPTTVSATAEPTPSAGISAPDDMTNPPSQTPVTQPGVVAGPGVDDLRITLGVLVDADADRGFRTGLELWQESVNGVGGICERDIALAIAGEDGVPGQLPDAYTELGTGVLGFVTLTENDDIDSELGSLLSTDQVPALTTIGTAADLTRTSPVLIGPTDGVLMINALDQLAAAGSLQTGDTVAVVGDGSAAALDAENGIDWYAEQAGLVVSVTAADNLESADVTGAAVIVALGSTALTADVAGQVGSVPVLTTLAGFDPTRLDDASATRVVVALGTPAPGSDHPGAVAVEAALTAAGRVLGQATFAGYAAGATWGRLLQNACDNGTLTRSGVATAMTTIGPASVDSLLADADPSRPVLDGLPASTSSSLAAADLSAPTGLRPLTGLVSAAGIADYLVTG